MLGEHRIIEIEWAVKNNKMFVPSPPKKNKGKIKSKPREFLIADEPMDVDEGEEPIGKKGKGRRRATGSEFGMELTNTNADGLNQSKRSLAAIEEAAGDDDDDDVETPPKKQRRGGKGKAKVVVAESSEDEWVPPAPPRRSKRKLVI